MNALSKDVSPAAAQTQGPEFLDEGGVTPTSIGRRRHFQAITHLAVLTAFIFPITILPYLLSRRRMSSLQRQVDSVGASVRTLQQDLSRASSNVATRADENRQMRALLRDLMQNANQSRLRAKQRDAEQVASNEAIRSDLRMLLNERQHARTQAATLRALGTSLADVAAFMHEVELEMGMLSQGKDRRGVDRLRALAFRMASLPRQDKAVNDPNRDQAVIDDRDLGP